MAVSLFIVSNRRPSSTFPFRAVAASQAGDDHVKDSNNAVDNSAQHGTDGVNNCHQARADGTEDALDLGGC